LQFCFLNPSNFASTSSSFVIGCEEWEIISVCGVKIADVSGVNLSGIIHGPEDFAGVELVGHSLEEVNAGLANVIAFTVPVRDFHFVKFVGTILH
jgi:hypothetical protein